MDDYNFNGTTGAPENSDGENRTTGENHAAESSNHAAESANRAYPYTDSVPNENRPIYNEFTSGAYRPHGAAGNPYAQQNPYRNEYTSKPPKQKKPHPFAKKIGTAAVLAVVFGVIAGLVFSGINLIGGNTALDKTGSAGSVSTVVTNSNEGKQKTVYDVSEVVENVMPSMVAIDITVMQTVQNPFAFFGYGSYQQEATGSGTGIIISKNNQYLYISTNYHVVEGARSITVTFCDGKSVSAEVKGTDEDSDLAVIQVPLSEIESETMSKIKLAVMGNSEALKLGEPAIAIGNALGYGQSVTVGYISALAKEVQLTDKTMNLIQTDAAINPGNSGGALINGNGEVIGINSVKYASTEVEGIGYAIPISDAVPIIEALTNGTALPESEKPYLGISGTDVTKQYQERFGLPEGVYVSSVTENSPAAKAGMNAYDIITSFDGVKITTMDELTDALAKKKSGDKVAITVMRSSNNAFGEVSLTVTLDSVSNAPDNDDDDNQQHGYQGGFGNYFG